MDVRDLTKALKSFLDLTIKDSTFVSQTVYKGTKSKGKPSIRKKFQEIQIEIIRP